MTKEELKGTIGTILEKFGFKGKGWSWYLSADSNIVAVDLQKSNYELKYYVNICCAPDGVNVEGVPTPKEHQFPIRIRAEGVFPSYEHNIRRMFDLGDNSLLDEQRRECISEFLTEYIEPFARKIGDISGLKSAIAEGAFERGLINRAAQERLGL